MDGYFRQDVKELYPLVADCLDAYNCVTEEPGYDDKIQTSLPKFNKKYLELLIPHLLYEQVWLSCCINFRYTRLKFYF